MSQCQFGREGGERSNAVGFKGDDKTNFSLHADVV